MKILIAMRRVFPLLGTMLLLLLAACGSTTHNGTLPSNPESRPVTAATLPFPVTAAALPMPVKPKPAPVPVPAPVAAKADVATAAALPMPVEPKPVHVVAMAAAALPSDITGHDINKLVLAGHDIQKLSLAGHDITKLNIKMLLSAGYDIRKLAQAGIDISVLASPSQAHASQAPSKSEKPLPAAPLLVRLAESAFHVPNPIFVKQTVVAQLRINPCKDLENMRLELETENTKRPGVLTTAQVEIADYMDAELKADKKDIEVTPLSPGRQRLVSCSTTTWSWNVTGLSEGEKEIKVTLLKILPNGETMTVPTEVYKLKVRVKPIDDVMRLLDLVTAIIKSTTTLVVATIGLIAALGFGWARKRQGKVGT